MDSLSLVPCQPVRYYKVIIFNDWITIGYNAFKQICFYDFYVHNLITLSGLYSELYCYTCCCTWYQSSCRPFSRLL